MKFIGREKELQELHLLLKKQSPSLVVIRGRRRIGKSRLIKEFAKDKEAWIFSGLPPTNETTRQGQIDHFSGQMAKNLSMPKIQTSDWSELFWHLAQLGQKGNRIIVFDEISWMGSKDPDFLGHLKNAWDLHLSNNPNLILILCGSVSAWIEKNILSHTGFLGRVSLDMLVEELPLDKCQEFWGSRKNRLSAYEKFKVLGVTGGVPKYLEEIIPEISAEENLQKLCFQPEGLLFREYDQIFSDLFSKKATTYSRIIELLAKNSALELQELSDKLGIQASGNVSSYLHDLMLAGFVAEDSTWNLKSKKTSTLKKFRLKDNYLRFYLKYIAPNRPKISKHLFEPQSLTQLTGWETIMGFQFENLVLNNLKGLLEKLHIRPSNVVMAGPFFQRPTLRQKGCQIDLLIQTNYHTLYLCEIKFRAREINNRVLGEVEQKIERLSRPKGYSVRPVLIHVNGVSPEVISSQTFDQIIDFSDFFNT